jgi:hypothetical protein
LHFGKNELYLAAKKAIVRSILQNKETDNIQMVISAGWNGVHMINGAGVHNPVKVTMEGTRVKTIDTLL